MNIRVYQPGDEVAQVAIFNTAAASLPGYKPATVEEQLRRIRALGFKPESRLYAIEGNEIKGYITFQDQGRISFPWTLPGQESLREPLLNALLEQVKSQGISRLFTAYRGDWSSVLEFFQQHGFRKSREMVNFVQKLTELPTMVTRRGISPTALKREEIPLMVAMVPNLFRLSGVELEKYLLSNPLFSNESTIVLRKADGSPQAVGLFILNEQYADPPKLDPLAPCFRLGAFGTEGMSTKRINGMFSFCAAPTRDAHPLGLDLLWCAIQRLDESNLDSLAAQVPSDVPHLLGFYDKYFRRQASFPILEREVG